MKGGSATHLSATDASGRAAAGDAMSVRFCRTNSESIHPKGAFENSKTATKIQKGPTGSEEDQYQLAA
jgi:hypothetical protein